MPYDPGNGKINVQMIKESDYKNQRFCEIMDSGKPLGAELYIDLLDEGRTYKLRATTDLQADTPIGIETGILRVDTSARNQYDPNNRYQTVLETKQLKKIASTARFELGTDGNPPVRWPTLVLDSRKTGKNFINWR